MKRRSQWAENGVDGGVKAEPRRESGGLGKASGFFYKGVNSSHV